MGTIRCCCCNDCTESVKADDLLLRATSKKNAPKRKKDLTYQEVIFFTPGGPVRRGLSFTLVSRAGSLLNARQKSRAISSYAGGATFTCLAGDIVFSMNGFESCLDLCTPTNSQGGHVAVRIRDQSTGGFVANVPINKSILQDFSRKIFSFLQDDDDYC